MSPENLPHTGMTSSYSNAVTALCHASRMNFSTKNCHQMGLGRHNNNTAINVNCECGHHWTLYIFKFHNYVRTQIMSKMNNHWEVCGTTFSGQWSRPHVPYVSYSVVFSASLSISCTFQAATCAKNDTLCWRMWCFLYAKPTLLHE